MMMLCGQSNPAWHWAAGAYPGKVGVLFGPSYYKRQAIRPWLPYVLDNDAFTSWAENVAWSESAWLEMVAHIRLYAQKPIWALIPDVVANREQTIAQWHEHVPVIKKAGWPCAFAVQDGMTPDDVPANADVIFVGGTDKFKWGTVEMWAKEFPRVHVGRVNSIDRVWQCDDLGVESVDGTGWFRDPTRDDKLPALLDWISGKRKKEQLILL